MADKGAGKEDSEALLDERLASVDWDDDAALNKVTNDVLKHYLKRNNLRGSGLNKARTRLPCGSLFFKTHRPSEPCPRDACPPLPPPHPVLIGHAASLTPY